MKMDMKKKDRSACKISKAGSDSKKEKMMMMKMNKNKSIIYKYTII